MANLTHVRKAFLEPFSSSTDPNGFLTNSRKSEAVVESNISTSSPAQKPAF